MITSLPHFMFMTFIKQMISSIKEKEWKQKQNKVKSINFYMLMISTELKKFKLSVKPRNLNKFHNLALIKKRITYIKQEWGDIYHFKLATHILHYKEERISKIRYVHCLCSSKTHSVFSNKKLIQDSFNEPISQCFVT